MNGDIFYIHVEMKHKPITKQKKPFYIFYQSTYSYIHTMALKSKDSWKYVRFSQKKENLTRIFMYRM